VKFDPSLPIYKSFKFRVSQAFKENGNLLALATTAAISAALLNPIPLIIGAVAEAIYLIFVPDSKWYTNRLQEKFDAEVIARREQLKEQIFPLVRPEIKQEFARLEQVREQINGQSRSEEPWFREALRKLDFLMEKYLQFAQKEAQFGAYIASVYAEVYQQTPAPQRRGMERPVTHPKEPPIEGRQIKNENYHPFIDLSEEWVENVIGSISNFYENELTDLNESIDSETVFANRTLMEKRQQIITRRREFISRVAQILTNLRLQMRLMSDTFGLINDEIRARSPEQVLSDIDDVMLQATSLTEAIDEITPMTEFVGTY
jgi:hypothetical protein